jgi:hypothetical protein
MWKDPYRFKPTESDHIGGWRIGSVEAVDGASKITKKG